MINNKLIEYSIIILFIGMWLSVGSDPYNYLFIFEDKSISNLDNQNFNIKVFINFIRSFFPIFSLLICIFIIIKYKLYLGQKNYFYILLAIHLIQIISTFYSKDLFISYENKIDHIGRYHWLISSISTILIFMIANKIQNFKIDTLFLISIIFLILMVTFFSYKILFDFFKPEITSPLYNMNIWRNSAFFLDHQIPRVTGLSRSILVIIIILMFIEIKSFNFFNYIKYFLLVVLGGLLFLYQSKFALIFLFFLSFYFIFRFSNKIRGLSIVIGILILQFSLFLGISNLKFSIVKENVKFDNKSIEVEKNRDKEDDLNKLNKLFEDPYFRKTYKQQSHGENELHGLELFNKIFFSGRIDLWKQSLSYIKDRPIIGYGSMSDRFLINLLRLDTKSTINPISNAFLYSIISGGILNLVLLIYLSFIILKQIFYTYQNKIALNQENNIFLLIILLLGSRMFIENSIMLFGVDFILLMNSLKFLDKK